MQKEQKISQRVFRIYTSVIGYEPRDVSYEPIHIYRQQLELESFYKTRGSWFAAHSSKRSTSPRIYTPPLLQNGNTGAVGCLARNIYGS